MRSPQGAVALACLLAAPIARAAEPPAAVDQGIAGFARHDEVVDARISPAGRTLAMVAIEGGHRALGLLDLSSRKLTRFRLEGDNAVSSVHWASEDRLVLALARETGSLATPQSLGELFGLAADAKGGRLIFGFRAGEMQTGTNIRKAQRDRAWATVVSRIRGEPHHVLIEAEAWREVGDRVVTAYRLDAVTGIKEEVAVAPLKNAHFIADEAGQLRIAWAFDAQARRQFRLRDGEGRWVEPGKLAGLRADSLPVAFSAKERTLYVEEGDDAGFTIAAVSIDSGERRVLARNAFAEPSQLVLDSDHRLVAVEFEPDVPAYTFVLPEHPIARVLQGLAAAYPDAYVRFVDASDGEGQVVVLVRSDRDPGQYLVVDTGTMTAVPIAKVRPWVRPEDSAEVSAFHIKASDGFRLHGYVTLPPGAGDARAPMVVLPHGGPHWVRDRWGYDAEAQLLAANGYAVLQVNFRGSSGYGRSYQEAGFGHWGDRMIEDLVDATRFAIRKGWADPHRICTYGASYGGYAAIEAALSAPDLFRCAASYAGVYDLERLPDSPLWVDSGIARRSLGVEVGLDREALRRASPLYDAARLTAPVFLIHGAEDDRAPFEVAERMRKALAAQGRPPEWLAEPHEGHGFYDEGARTRMYTRLLAFLRANTAAPPPPATPAPPP